MAARNLLSSMASDANGIVGNIEKAILIFPKAVKEEVKLEDGKIGSRDVTSGVLNDVMDVDVELLDFLSEKVFTVQFNPSSIRLNARGGGLIPVSNFGKAGDNQTSSIEFEAINPYITVSFTVIFDALNQADAFMEERFTLGATTLAKNAATAAVTAVKEFTVRPQVEGFLAALRNEDHRTMVFRWGKLTYAGILNSVSGTYTMFNTAGNPIRAEVEIGMLMGGTGDGNDENGYLHYWQKRYDKIIADNGKMDMDEVSSMSTSTMKQQFSNLLNL